MKDRLVEFPGRYYDVTTDKFIILQPAFGVITEAGSTYSKANVMPQSVCTALGIADHENAEPKDAFAAVANGRYYGRTSKISGGDTVGANDTYESKIAEFTVLDNNDYSNVVLNGNGKYSRIPVPLGAKQIRITGSATGVRATFGSAYANILKNGVSIGQVASFGTASSTATGIFQVSVTGDGTEYIEMFIFGEQDDSSDEEGICTAIYLMMEVIQ